ncbi:MAG: S8 family serine peptidase [Candidatus Electronema sp. VV]
MKEKKMCPLIAAATVVLFCGMTQAAQAADTTLMNKLAASKKIVAQKDVLADFAEGQEETEVIALVKPLSAAETDKIGRNFDLKSETGKRNARAAAAAAIKAVVDQLDSKQIKKIRKFSYVNGFAATITPDGLRQLADNPDVVSVEKDHDMSPDTFQGIPLMNAAAVRTAYKGAGVSIAVIDDGVDYMHPDMGGIALGSNTKIIGGFDIGDNDADPMPISPIADHSHGTSCAGIAAGSAPSGGTPGDYIGGVAPDAKLYALKVQDSAGFRYTSYAMNALDWAITHQYDDSNNPILIVSISLSSGEYTSVCDVAVPAYKEAVAKAKAAGIAVFSSASNDGLCNATASPACLSDTIAVGAVWDKNATPADLCVSGISANSCLLLTDAPECTSPAKKFAGKTMELDKVAYYSNSASFLDLLAPSHFAATPKASGDGTAAYNTSFGGTSAATPYAAGAAAVLQSAAKAKLGRYLTPNEVKMYLTTKGDPVTDSKSGITTPRVNLGNAEAVLDNCGLGRDLPANTWLMTAPSCQPSPAAIGSQYSELGAYNTNWRAWKWNTGTQSYPPAMADADPLALGEGNWLYSTNAATLALGGLFPSAEPCSSYGSGLLGKCFAIPLTPSGADSWQIVGYPFTSPLNWADVRVATYDGATWTQYTPSGAATANLMRKEYWRWNGSTYETKDDVTSGAVGVLQPQESFWVRILPGSSTLSAGGFKLLIPAR